MATHRTIVSIWKEQRSNANIITSATNTTSGKQSS